MDNLQGTLARLVVHGLPGFTKGQVKRLVTWLRKLADDLEKDPTGYSRRFIAKLHSK